MIERAFPIVSGEIPKLIGHTTILSDILRCLKKSVPDHLQIVGPRFSGKTVILSHLKQVIEKDPNLHYCNVVLWDVGHCTPINDADFIQQLSTKLSFEMRQTYPDYSEHLGVSSGTMAEIAEVLELLSDESKRILLILDGFDRALSSNSLTRNLWDQLREMAQNSSLRIITGSRKTLRELIRNPDAQTSDFWNIFLSEPVKVSCLSKNEVANIVLNIDGLEMDKGGITELYNYTNGYPIFVLELLNHILVLEDKNMVSNDNVCSAGEKAYSTLEAFIDQLWNDCAPSTQEQIRLICESNQTINANRDDKLSITGAGFAQANGNKLIKPSKLICRYLEEREDEGGSIERLFQTPEAYTINFNSVIAKRIGHLSSIDSDLSRYLKRCVEDLPNHPEVCLTSVRGIVDKCFDLIWQAEFGGKNVPGGHIDMWRHNNEHGVDDYQTSFPQGARRLKLLRLLTGTEKSDRTAKFVSRSTYFTLSATCPFGDFGQHVEGEKVELPMVYSALLLCVELIALVHTDLAAVH